MSPQELLSEVSVRAHALVQEQYRVFNEVIVPALEKERIRFLRRGEWSPEQDAWLRHFFATELLPVLSPIGLDPAHPFPRILNKSLNFIVSLSGKDAFGRNTGLAVVQAPRALPRLIRVPTEVAGTGPHDFVFLSSVIHAYVDELFPGMEASGCYQFRVTRNSDLFVDEEEAKDLAEALEDELSQRQWGDTVRLEVAPRSLTCITKWRGRVWVGTTDLGLCVLDGARLVPIKPNLRPTRMDSRGDLLLSQSEMIVGSADGESFRAIKKPTLETLFAPIAPRWNRRDDAADRFTVGR
jgi:hypothetical protein